MLTRREFLESATVTLFLVPLACSGDLGPSTSTSQTVPGCDGAGATSTVTQGHSHSVCVLASDLTSPSPAGATYSTSVSLDHTHTLVLTQDQLGRLGAGETVAMTTTATEGHTHAFTLQRGAVPSQPPTAPGVGSGPY